MDHTMPSAPPSFHDRLRAALRRDRRLPNATDATRREAFTAGYRWGFAHGGDDYGLGDDNPEGAWRGWAETGIVPE